MNRRSFLKVVGAGVAAAAVPALAANPAPSGMAMMMEAEYLGPLVFHDGFFFVSRTHGLIHSFEINNPGEW